MKGLDLRGSGEPAVCGDYQTVLRNCSLHFRGLVAVVELYGQLKY